MARTKQETTEKKQYGTGAAHAATAHKDNVLLRARQGHGFAAERANDMIDTVKGKRARLVGGDNAKAGPDRLVDGVLIQSKYCASAQASINACFDQGGKLIYQDQGKPMKIEVPGDQYTEALKLMARKLQGTGMKPAAAGRQAKSILVKGNVDYETARRIVEPGNIDSLSYDAARGAITAGKSGSVSVAIAYAYAIYNGADAAAATRVACAAGLKVGGVTWLSSIITAQATKSGAETLVREGSSWMVRQLGSKATLTIANTLSVGERALRSEVLNEGSRRLTGKAAEQLVTKALTGNVIAATVTTVILSATDLVQVFSGHISKAQLFKNVTNTAAGVAGGMSGALAGAAQGAAYLGWIPGGVAVGAFVGGVIGSIAGSSGAGAVSRTVTDWLIEDDAVQMMRQLEQVFIEEAQDYLLTQAEADAVMNQLQEKWDLREQMREMFASVSAEQYARWLIRPLAEGAVKRRKKIRLPTEKALLKGAAQLLEEDTQEEASTPPAPASGSALSPAVAWPFPTSARP
ncbi:hypothetical protein [Massilia niabensis]|uniref:Uncharacterized protein n=1 Tax=Massilia niabensis TaxID=544910 RepID=A0ABW0L2V6_9BURK